MGRLTLKSVRTCGPCPSMLTDQNFALYRPTRPSSVLRWQPKWRPYALAWSNWTLRRRPSLGCEIAMMYAPMRPDRRLKAVMPICF